MPSTRNRATAPFRLAAWLLDTALFVVTPGAAVAGALGPGRRTLYDEWTATSVVGRPA